MNPEASRALARSVLWQAVVLGLEPPSPLAAERLVSDQGARSLAEAAGLVAEGLDARVTALRDAGPPVTETHAALFGHTSRGRVPPYETEWGRDDLFQKPQELADLGGFLAAFGLKLEPSRRERVDHLGCEAELLAFLALRKALALDAGDAETAAAVARAERLLLRDHVARFAPAFGDALSREDARGFYGRLGELILALVAAECTHFEVEPGAPSLPLRPTDLDDQTLECGSGDELIQIQRASTLGPER